MLEKSIENRAPLAFEAKEKENHRLNCQKRTKSVVDVGELYTREGVAARKEKKR
jgi:hypothetical protein